MKRQGSTRALHFAVTGALLGSGLEAGCRTTTEPTYTNTGPMNAPGPDGGGAEGGEAPDHVNEGPVDEPPPEVTPTNPGPQPEPIPEQPKLDEGTNNVRKVADEPTPKYVNTVRVEDAPPPPSTKK